MANLFYGPGAYSQVSSGPTQSKGSYPPAKENKPPIEEEISEMIFAASPIAFVVDFTRAVRPDSHLRS